MSGRRLRAARLGPALAILVLLAISVTGCGDSDDPEPTSTQSSAQQPSPTAVPTDRPDPTVTPASEPQPTAAPTDGPIATTPAEAATATDDAGSGGDEEIIEQGRVIYQETAGGVGCATCHGADGRGIAAQNAPDIRRYSAAEMRVALDGVGMMSFIELTDEEVAAVVAYVRSLP